MYCLLSVGFDKSSCQFIISSVYKSILEGHFFSILDVGELKLIYGSVEAC